LAGNRVGIEEGVADMLAGGDKGDEQNRGNGQNQPGDAPGVGASQAAARSLQDLMVRLPGTRAEGRPGTRAAGPVDAPLRTNREYNGLDIAEPETATTAAAGTPTQTPLASETDAPFLLRPSSDQPAAPPRVSGPSLPGRTARRSTGRLIWFVIAFIAPVLLGGLYIFFVLPDQYVTEFRFSVRVPVGNPAAAPKSNGGSALSALFGGNPTPGADLLDNFTVADYVRSPQAARDVNAKVNLKVMYSKPSDSFTRLDETSSQEQLGRYWKGMVYSDYDVTTGLAVVRIKAYTPQDSLNIANTLLALSNQLVNDIGNQSQSDTVRFAKEQFTGANQHVIDLQRQIAGLARGGTDSPSIGVIQANTQLATTTRANMSLIQSQLDVLQGQLRNANAPQIVFLRRQLVANQRALAEAVSTANTISTNNFQVLTAQLANANGDLSDAQEALTNAQSAAASQRLYLTTYVRPTLPESPIAPDRWLNMLLLVVAAGMLWMVGLLVRNSILEHGL